MRAQGVFIGLVVLHMLGLVGVGWADVPTTARQTQIILHILDYVAVDYPGAVQEGRVLSQGEYDEQLDFAQQAQTLLAQLPPHADKPAMQHQAAQLLQRIQDKAPGPDVAEMAHTLRWSLIRAYNVAIAPRQAPPLQQAATLYQTHCVGCHGAEGRGDGLAGRQLDPAPSNFHDQQRMAQRSVYGLYSTITLGVEGTAMVAFQALSDEERWALAFYVSTLVNTEAERQRGAELWQSGTGPAWFLDLTSLATTTGQEVQTAHGSAGLQVLAYLRQHPETVATATEAPLARSVRLLNDSLAAYRQGQLRAAQDLAVAAYLDGFELVEASLDTIDRPLRLEVEAAMLGYRDLLKRTAPLAAVEAHVQQLQALLTQTQHQLVTTRVSAGEIFVSAFAILLREGLEAILVLAAIFALLSKSGRRDAFPYVHAGWVAALALGGLTWIVASYLVTISGSTRELTEGVTALIAAAVLLYVGFWMHSKAYAERWRVFLHHQLQEALSARTLWALALVSFLAVYREAFETVLFYQALWFQAASAYSAFLSGVLAAAVALLGLGWLIFRGSVRLPLGLFFGATSGLLALLAVIFAGKGVAALQEAGFLSVYPVPFPRLPLLGLYPNLQGLLLQAVLLVIVIGAFAYTYHTAKATHSSL